MGSSRLIQGRSSSAGPSFMVALWFLVLSGTFLSCFSASKQAISNGFGQSAVFPLQGNVYPQGYVLMGSLSRSRRVSSSFHPDPFLFRFLFGFYGWLVSSCSLSLNIHYLWLRFVEYSRYRYPFGLCLDFSWFFLGFDSFLGDITGAICHKVTFGESTSFILIDNWGSQCCRFYSVNLYVGNPPKPYLLDIDSGSDLTWLQCDAPCVRCTKVTQSMV